MAASQIKINFQLTTYLQVDSPSQLWEIFNGFLMEQTQ